MKSARRAIIGLLVLVGLGLAACAPAAGLPLVATPPPTPVTAVTTVAPTPPPRPQPASEQPRYGGVLKSVDTYEPPMLDFQQRGLIGVQFRTGPSYSRLIQYDPQDHRTIIPDLAKSWEMSPDGLVYTFHLRDGVKWHDGQPFTSADVKFSLNRVMNPPQGAAGISSGYFKAVSLIETPDKATARIVLKYPSAAFMSILALQRVGMIVPQHLLERDQHALEKAIVGTGPFKFKEAMSGVSFEAVRNPDYFVPGRPYLDGFKIYIIPDAGARLAALRTKQIHIIFSQPGISLAEKRIVEAESPGQLIAEKQLYLMADLIYLKLDTPPFNDARVRRAISLVSGREESFQLVYQGMGIASGPMPVEPYGKWSIPKADLARMPGFGPDKAANIAEAKKLLAEAGYPDGFSATISAKVGYPQGIRLGEALVSQLARIGIKAKMELLETGVFDKRVRNQHQFQISSYGAGFDLDDPDLMFSRLYVSRGDANLGEYSNPRLDELFEKQSRTLDYAERKKLVDQMQRIVLEESPIIFMGYEEAITPRWAEVRGYRAPIYLYLVHTLDYVWLAQ